MKLLLILQYNNIRPTYKSICNQGYNDGLEGEGFFFLKTTGLFKAQLYNKNSNGLKLKVYSTFQRLQTYLKRSLR